MRLFGFEVTLTPLYHIIPSLSERCVYCLDPIYKSNSSRISYCTECKNSFHTTCHNQWKHDCPICRHKLVRRYWFGSSLLIKLCEYLHTTFSSFLNDSRKLMFT